MTRLDPTVIDLLKERHGLSSYEQVASKLGRTAHTVAKWCKGTTVPSAEDLVKMQFLTGRPYGTMLLITEQSSPHKSAA